MPRARLRELGIVTGTLTPGPWNALTDVPGLRVGYTTLVRDQPSIIRTGVTAIWPRGPEIWTDAVFAGIHSFNGNGEMTGWAWIAEQGLLAAPLCITNTYSVGIVRDAICALAVRDKVPQPWLLPVVAETYDGWLSDAPSFPVTTEHAIAALDGAASGPLAEGNVGGGTGMICHEFKGGTGTASRIVQTAGGPSPRAMLRDAGSIIAVLATDAPLLPIQCQRLARRATTGLAWVGGVGFNGSGDIFIAFSTGNRVRQGEATSTVRMLSPDGMNPLFQAAAEATEEAILNALTSAETMSGLDGHLAHELPLDRLVEVMRRYRPAANIARPRL
jgi:D-aminopeptidase